MKNVILLIVFVAGGFLAYNFAPPFTKSMYLSQYETFIDDTKTNFRDYDKAAWDTKNDKFKQYSREYYEKFEADLTDAEREQVADWKLNYLSYQVKGKVRNKLDAVEDALLNF